MVYKRYIYKNGKKYGPYFYESKKENGKVISNYLGKKESVSLKKFVLFFFIIFGIILISSATVTNVNLNSFYGTNFTSEDLDVSYSLSDSDSAAVVWYRNGLSWPKLYIPFEVNNSRTTDIFRDYAKGFNGTKEGNLEWVSGGSYDGSGAVRMSGIDNSNLLTDFNINQLADNFTIMVWLKDEGPLANIGTITGSDIGNNVWVKTVANSNSKLYFYMLGKTGVEYDTKFNFRDGGWHHYVMSYDGDLLRIYFDGYPRTTIDVSGSITASTNFILGSRRAAGDEAWNGSMDDLIIFDYALSSEQINYFYSDNKNISNFETIVGQNWSACVTPLNSLTHTVGTEVCSIENITVLSENLGVSDLRILTSSGENLTSENLTSTYSLTSDNLNSNIFPIFDWKKDGVYQIYAYYPFEGYRDNFMRDYSIYNRTGIFVSDSIYSSSGGHDGNGSVIFNGIDRGQIKLNGVKPADLGDEFTIALWFKDFNSDSKKSVIFDARATFDIHATGSSSDITIDIDGITGLQNVGSWNGNNVYCTDITSEIQDNSWKHLIFTYNSSDLIFYINGIEEARCSGLSGSPSSSYEYITLGDRDIAAATQTALNGSIDEFIIINNSIDSTGANFLYNYGLSRIPFSQTTKGDNWSMCVTPITSYEDGNQVCSSLLEVLGSPPPSLFNPSAGLFTSNNRTEFNWTGTSPFQLLVDDNSDFSSPVLNTTLSETNYTLNSTQELNDSLYYWKVGTEDAGEYSYSSVRNFTIDTTLPIVLFNASTSDNNSYFNQESIFVQLNVTETNFANLTFYLFNSTEDLLNETFYGDGTMEINYTGLSEGIYYYNATVYDLANNVNSSETRKITLDSTYPLINFTENSLENNFFINYDSIFVEVNITETNFANVTFSLYNESNLDSPQNITTFDSLTTSINWTGLEFQTVYYYNVTITDKVGLENSTDTRVVTLDNIAPVVSNYSWPIGEDEVGGENILFNWTVYDNIDTSIACYPTANGNLLTSYVTYVANNSDGSVTASLPGGYQSLNITCFDDANNSGSLSIGINSYLVAVINITYPSITDRISQIVRPNSVIGFNVTEVAGNEFLNNVTLSLYDSNGSIIANLNDWTSDGESYETFTFDSYTFNFDSPRAINVTVTAFNNSLGSDINVTSEISLAYLRQSIGETGTPIIISNYPNVTYNLVGDNITVHIIGDLDTLYYDESLSILPPSSISEDNLTYSNLSTNVGSDFLNYIEYNYTISQAGTFLTSAAIQDFEGVWSNFSYEYFYASASSRTIDLYSENNITIKDIKSGITLWDNSSLSITIPDNAVYDIENNVEETNRYNLSFSFENASLTSDYNPFINYTSLSNETSPPSGKKRVYLFDLEVNFTYDSYELVLDYSSSTGTISDESTLALYKCSNVSNCQLELVSTTLNTTANTLTASLTNMSRFMLVENEVTNTVTQTVTVTSSGGTTTVYKNLQILTPGKATMTLADEIVMPITLKNPTDSVTLNSLKLSAYPNTQDLSTQFDRDTIDSLGVGKEETINLIIESHSYPGEYEIDLNVTGSNPSLEESAKIFIKLVENLAGGVVQERIVLVQDLFKENPQCLEFNDYLIEAEEFLETDPDKAKELVDYAIQSCKDLITSERTLAERVSSSLRQQKWERPIMISLAGMVLAILMFMWIARVRKISRAKNGKFSSSSNTSKGKGFFSKIFTGKKRKKAREIKDVFD